MTLSRKSWHYHVYTKWFSLDEPKNFCRYFWCFIGMSVLATFVSILVFIIAADIIIGMIYSAVNVSHFHDIIQDNAKYQFLATCGLIGWGAIAVAVLIFIGYAIFAKDNMITRFWKAITGKYCPKIEWVEPNSPSTI